MCSQKNAGFTLIELSIVMVIIALLVGGVLVGRSMIESSQINAQVSQIQRYDTATNSFRLKYNGLPADSAKAGYKIIPGGADQYGDGDGILNGGSSSTNWPANQALYFFVALSYSGLIQETYNGCNASYNCAGTGGWTGLIGKFYPQIAIAKGTGMVAIGGKGGGLYYFLGITVSDGMPWLHSISASGTMYPSQAYILDKKMDDGYPTTGNIFASNNRQTTSSTCTTCSSYTDSTVMQIAPNDNTCVKSDDTYNAAAAQTTANKCRLVVKSSTVPGN